MEKELKQYDINNMDISNMGELDRPTTIIGYVVRDIMEFIGLIKYFMSKCVMSN